jgi:acetone carboxylase gamma subunit
MSYPFRENLAVASEAGGKWIRCIKCGQRLCALSEDWKSACLKRIFPPTKAGPLMDVLDGRYVFEKLYCPSCGVLLNSEMVEEKNEADKAND